MNSVTQFFLTLWIAEFFSKGRKNNKRYKREARARRRKKDTMMYAIAFDSDTDVDIIDFLAWTFSPTAYVEALVAYDCGDLKDRKVIQIYSKARVCGRPAKDVQILDLGINCKEHPAVVKRLKDMN